MFVVYSESIVSVAVGENNHGMIKILEERVNNTKQSSSSCRRNDTIDHVVSVFGLFFNIFFRPDDT
jgi:hypothetical protein